MWEAIHFVVKYAPFWGIPSFMIGFQFGYIYWTKDMRFHSYMYWAWASFSIIVVIYYYVAGGPDESVSKLIRFIDGL